MSYSASMPPSMETGEKMKFPGEKTLFLKRDCKVMLVWNRSDALKNGSMGRFKSVDGNKLLVYFEKVGAVGIERVTWIQRNRQGEKIVSFRLSWGML